MTDTQVLETTRKCIQALLASAEDKYDQVKSNIPVRMSYEGEIIAYKTILGIIDDLRDKEETNG